MIVDHGTQEGFTVVAEAREYLLHLGRKELQKATEENPSHSNLASLGLHVVAPVSHFVTLALTN